MTYGKITSSGLLETLFLMVPGDHRASLHAAKGRTEGLTTASESCQVLGLLPGGQALDPSRFMLDSVMVEKKPSIAMSAKLLNNA